jgi:hypothetical protein
MLESQYRYGDTVDIPLALRTSKEDFTVSIVLLLVGTVPYVL